MDKKLNKTIDDYLVSYKNDIRNKMLELSFDDKSKMNELLEYIFEYDKLQFTKEDFVKRKRVRNSIPECNRCIAKRANGEQCTRRKKNDNEFCGTHSKGTPHGLVQACDIMNDTNERIEVFAQEIKGIVYYIDKRGNVYKTDDVLDEKENPLIIAKWKYENGSYTIPELGLV